MGRILKVELGLKPGAACASSLARVENKRPVLERAIVISPYFTYLSQLTFVQKLIDLFSQAAQECPNSNSRFTLPLLGGNSIWHQTGLTPYQKAKLLDSFVISKKDCRFFKQ